MNTLPNEIVDTIIYQGVFNESTCWGLIDLWNVVEVSRQFRDAVRRFWREHAFPFRARICRALRDVALSPQIIEALMALGSVLSFSGDIVLQSIVYGDRLGSWMRPAIALEGPSQRIDGTEGQSPTYNAISDLLRNNFEHYNSKEVALLSKALYYRLECTPKQSIGEFIESSGCRIIFTTKHSDSSLSSFIPIRTSVFLGETDDGQLHLGNITALRRREIHVKPTGFSVSSMLRERRRYIHAYSSKGATWERRQFTVRCRRCNAPLRFGRLRKKVAEPCIGVSELQDFFI